jgi:SAM-dependent methyltransferase
MPEHCPEGYLDPYRRAISEHGAGFAATLWESREGQVRRFDVMIDMAEFSGCTLVDAGCGPGDFAARLLERGIGFRRFIGLDAVPEMIEAARRRALPRCEFHIADVVADPRRLHIAGADFISISGALNTMAEETARRTVREAFDAAAQGVIFNFLSDRCTCQAAGRDLSPAHRFNTLVWLDWAMSLTTRVSFTQDYLDGHDATILLRHEAAA